MSAMGMRPKSTRATSVVELLVLLPVLLLVLFAMLYVGQLSLYKERTHFGGEYAIDATGDQSENAADQGTVTQLLYPSPVGELTVVEQPAQPAEIPVTGEIREMLDEMCQPIYSTTASGHYVFSGGQLRFVVTTHQDQHLTADGQYVTANRLRDDNVPELCSDLLQAWIERNRVDLTYTYTPDYIRLGRWALDVVDLTTRLQSVVRTDAKREVRNPPAGMKHQIEAVTTGNYMKSPGHVPDYPDFGGDERFWKSN